MRIKPRIPTRITQSGNQKEKTTGTQSTEKSLNSKVLADTVKVEEPPNTDVSIETLKVGTDANREIIIDKLNIEVPSNSEENVERLSKVTPLNITKKTYADVLKLDLLQRNIECPSTLSSSKNNDINSEVRNNLSVAFSLTLNPNECFGKS